MVIELHIHMQSVCFFFQILFHLCGKKIGLFESGVCDEPQQGACMALGHLKKLKYVPVVGVLCLHCGGAQVQFLVRELGCHMDSAQPKLITYLN